MINVDTLYNRIADLVLKDKTGYLTNGEFNRLLVSAQELVFDYEYAQYEKKQFVSDALATFVKTAQTTVTLGNAGARPSDYRHDLRNATMKLAVSVDGVATIVSKTCTYLHQDEINLTIDSALRGPSDDRFYYKYENGVQRVLPAYNGYFLLRYLRVPTTPVRAVTLDVSNDQENYTATGTVHLEWPSHMIRIFEDIMCWYLGLQIRDNEIIQWANQKMEKKP